MSQAVKRPSEKACLTIVGVVQPTAFSGELVELHPPYEELRG